MCSRTSPCARSRTPWPCRSERRRGRPALMGRVRRRGRTRRGARRALAQGFGPARRAAAPGTHPSLPAPKTRPRSSDPAPLRTSAAGTLRRLQRTQPSAGAGQNARPRTPAAWLARSPARTPLGLSVAPNARGPERSPKRPACGAGAAPNARGPERLRPGTRAALNARTPNAAQNARGAHRGRREDGRRAGAAMPWKAQSSLGL